MTTLGESLSVVIGANADPLVQELNKSAAAVNHWGRSCRESLEMVSEAAELMSGVMEGAVGGGLAYLGKMLLENAASLEEQAKQVGLSVGKFQEYRFGAQQAGVSNEDFTTGLNKLSKTLGAAQAGIQASKDVFDRWGIAVTDAHGNALDMDQVLHNVADRFASITNPAYKSIAATELMGKSAYVLINYLSQGGKGIDELAKKATDLGIVLDERTTKSAHEASIELKAMADVIGSNLSGAMVTMMPSAEHMAWIFEKISKFATFISRGLGGDVGVLFDPNASVDDVQGKIDFLKKEISDIQNSPPTFFNRGDGSQLNEDIRLVTALQEKLKGLKQAQNSGSASSASGGSGSSAGNSKWGGPTDPAALRAAAAEQESAFKKVLDSENKQGDAIKKAHQDIADYIAKLQEENKELGLSNAQKEISKNLFEAENMARKAGTHLLDEEKQKITDETNAITAQNAIIEENKKDMEEARQFANQLASTMTSSFENAIIGGEKFSSVLQGLAQDMEKMILRAEILKPLTNFLVGGEGASGGGGLFGGLKSLLPGFASGGDVTGPSIVGERGPELFIPNVAGSVMPNRALGSAGGGSSLNPKFEFNVSVSGPAAGDPKTAANAGAAFAAAAKAQIQQILIDQQRIGGALWGTR